MNPIAIVAFLIFSLEVTPFYSMLVLGSANTVKYLSLIILCLFLTLRSGKLSINTATVLLLLIAMNEIVLNLLHGGISLNGSRIVISVMIFSLLINRKDTIAQFLVILRGFHKFTVYVFLLSVALVVLLGESVLHTPLPIVDDTIFNKVSYLGALKIEAFLIFNFNTFAVPDFNFLGLSVLPSGLSGEPHAFFTYLLVSTAILQMSGHLSHRLGTFSTLAMTLCLSYSNLAALGASALVLLFLTIIQRFGLKSIQNIVAVGFVCGALYVGFEYLQIDNIFVVASVLDRSFAQSFAIVTRMFSMYFGSYSLEDIPTYFNDYQILPISVTSVVLFMTFVMYVISWFDTSLGRLRCFVLIYILFYTGKSLGVTIFLPYSILSILLLTSRKI